MKKSTLAASILLAVTISCGRDENLSRGDQQYEVVQESAGGTVTSTLGGIDGVPPLAPVTGTNADTTTAFTLPSTTMPATPGQPGTLAGTLPPGAIYRGDAGTPRPARPSAPPPPQPTDQPVADRFPTPQPPVVEDPTPPKPTETSNEQRNEKEEEEEAAPAEEPAPPPPPPSATDAPGTA